MNALLKLPEYYEALSRYESTAVTLGDPGLLGVLYARMGWCEWSFGHFDQAIQTTGKATELCAATGNTEDAAQAYVHWQWSHLCRGEFHQSLARRDDVLRNLNDSVNPRLYLFAVGGASIAYTWLGRWDQAVQEAQKGLRAGEEVSDNSIISLSAWALALAYTAKGDLARALEYGELGVQKAPTPGDKTWASCVLAATWCRVGDAPRGIAVLSQAVSVLRAARFIWSEVCVLWLAEGYALAGEHEHARRALEELLDSASRHGMKFLIGCAHRLLGEIALRTNPAQVEAPLAAPHFDRSLAILQEIEAENELALAYASYGRLHHQQGDVAKSRACLTRAIEIFERLGTSIEPDRLRRTLAEVSEG